VADAIANPYRPGVGLRPAYLAGRQGNIDTFKSTLASAPAIPGNARVTGLRGVGKTVLLARFQEEAEAAGWSTISVELEPRHCTDAALSELIKSKAEELAQNLSAAVRVRGAAKNAAAAARKALTVTYEGFEWSMAGDLDPSSKEVAEYILKASALATKAGKRGLVLLLDEAQILIDDKAATGDHPLSTLVAAVSTLQKQAAPVCLVLCGLPTLAVNLLTARTYSERMFRGFKIGSLDADDAIAAFREPIANTGVQATNELVDQVVQDVDGYPYFVQLWGAELWETTVNAGMNVMTLETLKLIEDRIQERLDLDFYEPRIESLTPAEQDLLMASATCDYPPLMVSDLNAASPKSNENINVLLGRLVKANVLYRPRKGQYRYTAPKFRDFLIRRAEATDDDY
jgi:hypothetical protein